MDGYLEVPVADLESGQPLEVNSQKGSEKKKKKVKGKVPEKIQLK